MDGNADDILQIVMSQFFVYIMASYSRVLYTGVTNNLERRVAEHRAGKVSGFTKKYRVKRLVYFEVYPEPGAAIGREKQLKGLGRSKKIALIEADNPDWEDLGNKLNLDSTVHSDSSSDQGSSSE